MSEGEAGTFAREGCDRGVASSVSVLIDNVLIRRVEAEADMLVYVAHWRYVVE